MGGGGGGGGGKGRREERKESFVTFQVWWLKEKQKVIISCKHEENTLVL